MTRDYLLSGRRTTISLLVHLSFSRVNKHYNLVYNMSWPNVLSYLINKSYANEGDELYKASLSTSLPWIDVSDQV
jgi:hypothetical protein